MVRDNVDLMDTQVIPDVQGDAKEEDDDDQNSSDRGRK